MSDNQNTFISDDNWEYDWGNKPQDNNPDEKTELENFILSLNLDEEISTFINSGENIQIDYLLYCYRDIYNNDKYNNDYYKISLRLTNMLIKSNKWEEMSSINIIDNWNQNNKLTKAIFIRYLIDKNVDLNRQQLISLLTNMKEFRFYSIYKNQYIKNFNKKLTDLFLDEECFRIMIDNNIFIDIISIIFEIIFLPKYHKILLEKLTEYGFDDNIYLWCFYVKNLNLDMSYETRKMIKFILKFPYYIELFRIRENPKLSKLLNLN